MKTIVTHLSPDQDAICSIWLLKRFFPGFSDARVEFVPAGQTLSNRAPDADPDVVHVDTGLGRFDHHQTSDRSLCAAVLVLREILRQKYVRNNLDKEALEKLTAVVLEVDHAGDKLWPAPENDHWDFLPDNILDGLKYKDEDQQNLVNYGMKTFDGVFWGMKKKLAGRKILAKGFFFDSPWGRGVGVKTAAEGMHSLGERLGYKVIIQKDPRRGNVRIHVHPIETTADLTPVYEELQKRDPKSDWFLHANKHLLLNGSSKNPSMRPTKLTLEEVIEIVKNLSSRTCLAGRQA